MMAAFSLSPSPVFLKTNSRRFKTRVKQACRFEISGNTSKPDDINEETPQIALNMHNNVGRRNLLLGLGGLYGFTSIVPTALGTPIAAPDDLADCVAANSGFQNKNDIRRERSCCPPVLSHNAPKDYLLPKNPSVIRVRPAAQRASDEYIAKYRKAIKAMRDLPNDDPRSFKQQAKIHCAYCNGGYSQIKTGSADKEIQIHNSWLFYPFHRWYLYFYERILGNLIGDETFALPYWNWDNPTGMTLPAMFEDPKPDKELRQNPLFNAYRDARHLPPAIVDMEYDGSEYGTSCIDQIGINLSAMYREMISSATDTTSFFGGEYKAGNDQKPSVGSIEGGVHTAIHIWTSDLRMPNWEDMGNFYSAGYDPLFYVHHANVDRMWNIWKELDIRGHHDPTDPDWLNASYVFYDENKELVRVYNRDCCDTKLMGYDFAESRIPWSESRPVPRTKNPNRKAQARSLRQPVDRVEDKEFPLKLDQTQKMLVKRPSVNRTKEDKEKANEILMLKGIRFDSEKFVKFDVFVDDKDDEPSTTAADSQFAGSFAQLPHNQTNQMFMTSAVRFGITELLEDMNAEDDESILVTLVPRIGCEDATVAEITIELVPID